MVVSWVGRCKGDKTSNNYDIAKEEDKRWRSARTVLNGGEREQEPAKPQQRFPASIRDLLGDNVMSLM